MADKKELQGGPEEGAESTVTTKPVSSSNGGESSSSRGAEKRSASPEEEEASAAPYPSKVVKIGFRIGGHAGKKAPSSISLKPDPTKLKDAPLTAAKKKSSVAAVFNDEDDVSMSMHHGGESSSSHGDEKRSASPEEEEEDEEASAAPYPSKVVKIGFAVGSQIGKKAPSISIKLNAAKPKDTPPTAAKKKPLVAAVFNEDDSEPEEMPPEAKMRMKNIGRDTPTSAGPNSFNKGKHGFSDNQKLWERNIKSQLEHIPDD